MNARQVHAVLAAGVHNPDLIARWRTEPRLLLRLGIEPESLDLAALWKFAGLTVKVRHNCVRQELPMTFRLLGLAGMEIEFFAAYAAFCASSGRRLAATTEDRTRDLTQFLEQWLDLDHVDHTLVWDMIRHEQTLVLLNKAASSPPPVPPPDQSGALVRRPSPACVPLVCGRIVLHEMRCDPLAVGAALRQSMPTLADRELRTRHYCYWRREGAAEIQVLELDEFGYYALSLVDGNRSAADLSRQLGGTRRPTRGFMRLLGQLASTGILVLHKPRKAHAV